MPDADRTAGLRDRQRVVSANLPPLKRRWAHRSRFEKSGVREQQGFRGHLGRPLDRVLGCVRDVAYESEPVAGLDHLGAESGEPMVHDGSGLEVADVIGRVVHKLQVPDAALMGFLKSLELSLEKVEPFHVGNDRRLSRFMGGFEIGAGKRPAQAVVGDHFIHPGEALEMVPIELARLGCAQCGQNALRIPAENRAVRHVGEACDRQRSRPHAVRKVVARRRFRRDPGAAAMCMDVERDGFAQDIERGRCGLGRLGGGCRTARSNLAGEHRADRAQRRAPHPVPARDLISVTAAIHLILPKICRRSVEVRGVLLRLKVKCFDAFTRLDENRLHWMPCVLRDAPQLRRALLSMMACCRWHKRNYLMLRCFA